jgi:hypothetical protein
MGHFHQFYFGAALLGTRQAALEHELTLEGLDATSRDHSGVVTENMMDQIRKHFRDLDLIHPAAVSYEGTWNSSRPAKSCAALGPKYD